MGLNNSKDKEITLQLEISVPKKKETSPIDKEYIEELFTLVHDTNTGKADDYDYIGFIIKVLDYFDDLDPLDMTKYLSV